MKNRLPRLYVQQIGSGKELYLPLLLEADPNKKRIDLYLYRGCLYGLFADETLLGVAVVVKHNGSGICELKNIAIAEKYRGNGYGSALMRYLMGLWAQECDAMLVCVSEERRGFCEKFGFRYMHAQPEFFATNGPKSVREADRICANTLYFSAALPKKKLWQNEFVFGNA